MIKALFLLCREKISFLERSCSRKTKVQPHSIEPSQQKLNPSAAHLFYANDNLPAGRSYSLTEDLYRTGIEQRRSDMVKTLDTNKTLKNMNQAWQTNLSDLPCPSTPLMIHYRRDSLPMDIPKRIIAPPPPRSRSRSKKDNHIEQIDSN